MTNDDIEFDDIDFDEETSGKQVKSRKQQKNSTIIKNIALVVGVIVVVIAIILAGVWFFSGQSDNNKADVEPKTPPYQDVSEDVMDKLSQGTVLRFGNNEKNTITIIADPKQIGRNSEIISGHPSNLVKAVQNNKLGLNLYLVADNKEREDGVHSMIAAATCRLGKDKTETKTPTLSGIVNAGDKLQGDESATGAAKLMGMKKNTDCAAASNEAYTKTISNAQYFMQEHLDAPDPGIIISSGGAISDIENLKTDWVDRAIQGDNAKNFLADTATSSTGN